VSGAGGETDEMCARIALDNVTDQLKQVFATIQSGHA
jgi:hypothetical protein